MINSWWVVNQKEVYLIFCVWSLFFCKITCHFGVTRFLHEKSKLGQSLLKFGYVQNNKIFWIARNPNRGFALPTNFLRAKPPKILYLHVSFCCPLFSLRANTTFFLFCTYYHRLKDNSLRANYSHPLFCT